MLAFIINIVLIGLIMGAFFKFMYPKPPKDFFAKQGDDTTVRICQSCGHSLATYRGILMDGNSEPKMTDQHGNLLFFCNDDHKNDYLANHHKPS